MPLFSKRGIGPATLFWLSGLLPANSQVIEIEPAEVGPYPVGTTSVAVLEAYDSLSAEEMHAFLVRTHPSGRFMSDILENPRAAWSFQVNVPNIPLLYGNHSGGMMDYLAFISYPTSSKNNRADYHFPSNGDPNAVFDRMQGADDAPGFDNPHVRYPLIILSHGGGVHALWTVDTARFFASHGYIVASIFHGDGAIGDSGNSLFALRPLSIKALIDSLLESNSFGPHIDAQRIGIQGTSLGGFTSLSTMGGKVFNHPQSIIDERIRAGVALEPTIWRMVDDTYQEVFGVDNQALSNIERPYLSVYGTEHPRPFDEVELVQGSAFAISLPGQPHVFEAPSWSDVLNWEFVFFEAYLKNDDNALRKLRAASSVKGFNPDFQLFNKQQIVPQPILLRSQAFSEPKSAIPSLRIVEGIPRLRLTFPAYYSDRLAFDYDLQFSGDCINWQTLNAEVENSDDSSLGQPDEFRWQQVQDPQPPPLPQHSRFYRIRAAIR